jgi:hypothetical protein
MLQQYLDTAAQMEDNSQLISLTNLRARLMTETETGRRLEKQQIALHGLNREAKAQNGLSPDLLLKHLLKHQGDEGIENALVMAGQGALTYQFFQLLTNEIEKEEKAKKQESVKQLTGMRERLLKVYDAMQEQSQRMLAEAEETLHKILAAEDKEKAVQDNLPNIDDAFMYLLSTRIAQADQQKKKDEAKALNQIHEMILELAANQYPPEIMLLNELMEAEKSKDRQRILDENDDLVSPELVKVLEALMKELNQAGQEDLNGRLRDIKTLVQARL